MESREQTLLEVDGRRRISLGSLAQFDRYLASVEDDGTIVLEPAVVMSAAQARLNAAQDTMNEIDEFLANPETGTGRPTRRKRGDQR